MSEAKIDTTGVPTARLGWGLITQHKLRYAINVLMWASMWVMPVIPAVITRTFFDSLTGDIGDAPPVALLVATFLAVYLVPVLFVAVERMIGRRARPAPAPPGGGKAS